ncbi:GyrI-like domain-containing protein, partial [Actinoplanes utahensis]|uniref:GyrI-like domain-containing protein n=1 Tax=Actinoplanes utahensis TaxID=1869 RepID=UPI0005BB167A
MTYEVTVKEVAIRPVAALTLRANLATIGEAIQHGFGTVIGAVSTAGATPDGPPFVIYHAVLDADTEGDVEICVPVPAGATLPEGVVRYYEIPAGKVAATIHHGPYQEISPAYQVLETWIEEHGAGPHGAPREVYLDVPETVAPEELRTEVQFPIGEVTA